MLHFYHLDCVPNTAWNKSINLDEISNLHQRSESNLYFFKKISSYGKIW